MSTIYEIMSEQNRARIKEEMDAIRLEEEAARGQSVLDKCLALLGSLMISVGEKLRNRHCSSQETGSVQLIHKVA